MSKRVMSYWTAPGSLSNTFISKDVNTKEVIQKVCFFYGVEYLELMSKSRVRNIVDARNTIYYILNRCCKVSLTEIGRILKKNHATVLSGANRVEGFMEFDKVFKVQINNLINTDIIKHN